ncbi:MAG: DNA topoisomerase 4 subunit A [Thermoflexales bacterium]|nr:DNA topoisomerase 4 subunit A [Thermoflexales bacterium]MDW8350917.1 DNA topoisomerase (ATP-hydrolyzing) [Anaerolineae bacterium]
MAKKQPASTGGDGRTPVQAVIELEDNRFGRIRRTDINREMQTSYLSYAMSVIVSRALPDARDGLKPVQRRILYVMHDTGLRPDAPYRKSARIVGDVLGKYHPHGDQSVYDAMARMAQDFSMRYPLVDGQGNFGSVDGDPPAAMRYTEARLSRPAMDLLGDIEKNTVDFTDNYDGTTREPTVLPAALPNLILNGATGIAVGMATNIPPHNLGEIVDAIAFMIDRIAEKRGAAKQLQQWTLPEAEVDVDELMNFVKGPDFPTGGIVFRYDERAEGGDAIKSAYATGRGKIIVQAKAHFEEGARGRNHIVVTELPYAVNKSALIERIADLVRDGKITGITDIHDESDRRGMRIVIDINKNDDPRQVLSALYKHTAMRTSFGVIMLALVNGEPRVLPLRRMLQVFIEHRLIVIKRRSEFDLDEARRRAHILEGLVKALDIIDEIIRLIRTSRDTDAARQGLIRQFEFSEAQAQAILDMPLRRLTQLDRKRLEEELAEKRKLIKYLEDLLKNPIKILGVIKEELQALKDKYGDSRRTTIVGRVEEKPATTRRKAEAAKRSGAPSDNRQSATEDFPLTVHELIGDETAYVIIGQNGKIGRVGELPRVTSAAEVAPVAIVKARTKEMVYVIGASGKGVALSVGTLPQEDVTRGQGALLSAISAFPADDEVAGAFAVDRAAVKKGDDESGPYMVCATAKGMVKRSSAGILPGVPGQAFTAIGLGEDDSVTDVRLVQGHEDLMMFTQQGMAIRFKQDEVRPMGLPAGGVVGIKLADGDMVMSLGVADKKDKEREVVIGTTDGRAKRVAFRQYPVQGRAGKGVITAKLAKDVTVAGAVIAAPDDTIVYVTFKNNTKSLKAKNLTRRSRDAGGDEVIGLSGGDYLMRMIVIQK